MVVPLRRDLDMLTMPIPNKRRKTKQQRRQKRTTTAAMANQQDLLSSSTSKKDLASSQTMMAAAMSSCIKALFIAKASGVWRRTSRLSSMRSSKTMANGKRSMSRDRMERIALAKRKRIIMMTAHIRNQEEDVEAVEESVSNAAKKAIFRGSARKEAAVEEVVVEEVAVSATNAANRVIFRESVHLEAVEAVEEETRVLSAEKKDIIRGTARVEEEEEGAEAEEEEEEATDIKAAAVTAGVAVKNGDLDVTILWEIKSTTCSSLYR
mmetsp:Transcript_17057/g.27216  ORF Transcript_17057/g.27216 Transcript_17057/m.27216 type:complete len:266 (+) Transcript_17057:319-1116(+)